MANNKKLGKEAALDTQIASGMVLAGLGSEKGLAALQQVLQGANDAPQAVAHVLFMFVMQVKDKMEQQGMPVDDKVWLASGGALDRILFDTVGILAGVLGFKEAGNPEFVHALKDAVVNMMLDSDSQSEAAPEEQAPPNQSAQAPAGLLAGGMQ